MDSGDWKAMLAACQRGDETEVRYYLDQGIDPDFQHPELGTTALHEAVLYQHFAVVQLLVARGASLKEVREFGGGTPAQVARQAGHQEIYRWLKQQEPRRSAWWRKWTRLHL